MSNFTEYLKESKVSWRITKFASKEDYEAQKFFDSTTFEGNLLLNLGITTLLMSLTDRPSGRWIQEYTIGIGDGVSPVNPSQTDLQGENQFFGLMVTEDMGGEFGNTYPIVVDQTIIWKSVFNVDEANFAWQEFGIRARRYPQSPVIYILINRKVQNMGTKVQGQIWDMTVSITMS